MMALNYQDCWEERGRKRIVRGILPILKENILVINVGTFENLGRKNLYPIKPGKYQVKQIFTGFSTTGLFRAFTVLICIVRVSKRENVCPFPGHKSCPRTKDYEIFFCGF